MPYFYKHFYPFFETRHSVIGRGAILIHLLYFSKLNNLEPGLNQYGKQHTLGVIKLVLVAVNRLGGFYKNNSFASRGVWTLSEASPQMCCVVSFYW